MLTLHPDTTLRIVDERNDEWRAQAERERHSGAQRKTARRVALRPSGRR